MGKEIIRGPSAGGEECNPAEGGVRAPAAEDGAFRTLTLKGWPLAEPEIGDGRRARESEGDRPRWGSPMHTRILISGPDGNGILLMYAIMVVKEDIDSPRRIPTSGADGGACCVRADEELARSQRDFR